MNAPASMSPRPPLGAAPPAAIAEDGLADGVSIEGLAFALAQLLHRTGAPVWRVEGGVQRLGRALGRPMACMATPTGVFVQVDDRLRVLRVHPAGVDLAVQAEAELALAALESGALRVEALGQRLLELLAPRRPRPLLDLLGGLAVPVGAAALFGGGWGELLGAGLAGIAVAGLDLGAVNRPGLGRLLPLLAGLLAAALPRALAPVFPMNEQLVTLAALIVVLPGLSFTVALAELATGHLSAGTARAAGAIITLLELALGLGFASRMVPALAPPASSGLALPPGAAAVALLATGLGLTVLFRARKKDAHIVILAVTGAYLSVKGLAPVLGADGAAFTTAALLSVAGDLLHRFSGRSPQLITVPGVLLLVPGAVGLSALRDLLEQQTLSGLGAVVDMFALAGSIVGGLLVAASVSALQRRPGPGMLAG